MFDLLISYNFYCSYTPSKAETQGKKLVGGMQIDDEDESTEEEDDADDHVPAFDGGYNPADFENLPVSADIKELFQYIGRYTPQQVINKLNQNFKCKSCNLVLSQYLSWVNHIKMAGRIENLEA